MRSSSGEDERVCHFQFDALLVENPVYPEPAQHDGQDQDNGKVGENE